MEIQKNNGNIYKAKIHIIEQDILCKDEKQARILIKMFKEMADTVTESRHSMI